MTATFEPEDYVLRWPTDLFRERLSSLINSQKKFLPTWDDEVDLLLDDAFETGHPVDAFRGARKVIHRTTIDPWDRDRDGTEPVADMPPTRRFLIDMLRAADAFPHEVRRRPYRSQLGRRDAGLPRLSRFATAERFAKIIKSFDERGYFDRSFGKDCVDAPRTIDPSILIEEEIGVDGLWPLYPEILASREELFLDLTEVFGEFVAAPRTRTLHNYADCGWHVDDFDVRLGRDVYYWEVNRLLSRTEHGLQIATSGEDRGRLVVAQGDARNDLVAQTIEGARDETRSPIEHAVSLFRRRGATAEEKRSACVALAGVLELRRSLLKDKLLRKDEGALFQIANEFDVRHRSQSQKGDYDPAFLDWIFWWYLGTIELTDRIIARSRNP